MKHEIFVETPEDFSPGKFYNRVQGREFLSKIEWNGSSEQIKSFNLDVEKGIDYLLDVPKEMAIEIIRTLHFVSESYCGKVPFVPSILEMCKISNLIQKIRCVYFK